MSLRKRRDEIVRRWETAIRAASEMAPEVRSVLRAQLPRFLDELEQSAARADAPAAPTLDTRGLDAPGLSRLVTELAALRTAILESAPGEAVATVNAALDVAIGQVVQRLVAEHDRAVQSSRKSEARHRAVLDNIDIGFCIVEVLFDGEGSPVDYRFDEVNAAFERHTGLVEAAGKRMRELAPDHEEHWFQIYGRVALTGEPARFENEAKALNRWFDVQAVRVGDPANRQVAILFADITDRRRTLDAIREANERLRDADRRKDDFLGMLSHELRNPLAPIRNSLYLLEHATPGGAQARRAREVVGRQVDHLTRLVDDLLDVTRISRGKIELARTVFDLGDLARRTCDDHHSLFEQKGVVLDSHIPLEPVHVEADPTRMAQVVGNLLQNAVRFTPGGGRVEVELLARDGLAALAVRDTGIGIEPSELEQMFEPFVQAKQDLARTHGGLGLGLALVKGLVELHGGSVLAHSGGAGRGSEFVVRLPLAERTVSAAETVSGARDRPRRKILIIEDNLDAAETLAEILELGGHRVKLAADGKTGIAVAREEKPDVVLCDIGLPDLTGYDVARALRAIDELRTTRLIAVTGYTQPEDKRRAEEAGFDAHLSKPPALDALNDLLEDLAA